MDTDILKQGLKQHFGFDNFQVGQLPVIQSVLAGQPTLAVMPTGAGKSLCYQLPAMLLDGLTLVISPLISLMKDQVDALQNKGISAIFLNSSLKPDEQRTILKAIAQKEYRLVYVAPERFKQESFIRILQKVEISLFAIDEAHCISRWGHDFRPDYSLLGKYIKLIQPARILACTATATPFVRTDIINTLEIPEAQQEIAGFLRSNLYLEAKVCPTEKDRKSLLEEAIRHPLAQEGSIIIYASTRKKVESYGEFLADRHGSDLVCIYHGGMSDAKRSIAQDEFMQGHKRIVVATNAFGMGIDRADVRAVIHLDLPRTLEGYYQEVGRAGRDGQASYCLLLHSLRDSRIHHFLIDKSHPSSSSLQHVWELLRTQGAMSVPEVEEVFNQRDWGDPMASIRQLTHHQIIQKDPWGDHLNVVGDYAMVEHVESLPLPLKELDEHRDREIQQHQSMVNFVQSPQCRHAHLLFYFGEKHVERCPNPATCDRCCSSELASSKRDANRGELCTDEHRLFLKALSGVARAEGYFGLYKVADMLGGSKTLTRDQHFLSRLSTYGILKHLGVKKCRIFLQYLVADALCELSPRIMQDGSMSDYKTIKLTTLGLAVMRSKEMPTLRLKAEWIQAERKLTRVPPLMDRASRRTRNRSNQVQTSTSSTRTPSRQAPSRQAPSRQAPSRQAPSRQAPSRQSSMRPVPTTSHQRSPIVNQKSMDELTLESKLKQYRLEQARLRDLPAFTIFSNQVLHALIEAKPYNQQTFLAIRGLGPSKWAQFGQPILKIIEDHSS